MTIVYKIKYYMWQTPGRLAVNIRRALATGTGRIFLVPMATGWQQVHKTAGCKYR